MDPGSRLEKVLLAVLWLFILWGAVNGALWVVPQMLVNTDWSAPNERFVAGATILALLWIGIAMLHITIRIYFPPSHPEKDPLPPPEETEASC